jgi:hypothetical protein
LEWVLKVDGAAAGSALASLIPIRLLFGTG